MPTLALARAPGGLREAVLELSFILDLFFWLMRRFAGASSVSMVVGVMTLHHKEAQREEAKRRKEEMVGGLLRGGGQRQQIVNYPFDKDMPKTTFETSAKESLVRKEIMAVNLVRYHDIRNIDDALHSYMPANFIQWKLHNGVPTHPEFVMDHTDLLAVGCNCDAMEAAMLKSQEKQKKLAAIEVSLASLPSVAIKHLRVKNDSSTDYRYKVNRTAGCNTDGSLDMRYSSNRVEGYNKDGSKDKRYKRNW